MTDPNDMEDPQACEILPPMLFEAWWETRMAYVEIYESGLAFKEGMEFAYLLLKPYLKAALPHYEARIRDTRLGRADERLVMALAQYKELATYEKI